MKFQKMLLKFKYELLIFALLLMQAGLRIHWAHPVRTDFLTLFLLDYKVGYSSRLLIGSLVNVFAHSVITEKWLFGFILVSYSITYFILALLLGKLIRSADENLKNIIIFLVAVFIFTSFSIRVFIQYIGLLDIYWFLLSLIAVVCMRNRITKWLIPLICVTGLAVHYGFAMTFLPFIFGLLLYEIYSSGGKKSSVALTAVSFLTMIGSTVFFAVFANRFMKLDKAGTYAYLSGKANFPVWKLYYEGYLFYSDASTGKSYKNIGDVLKFLIQTAFTDIRTNNYIISFLFVLPLLILLFFVWKNAAKTSSKKSEKVFMYFCMALPLPSLPSFIISTDMERFLGEIIIVQFCMIFYLIFNKNEAIITSLKKAEGFFKSNPMLLILLLIFSISSFFIK